jgi:hypothetical protein
MLVDQLHRARHAKLETAAAGLLHLHRRLPLQQPARQQQQPGFQVVGDIGQADAAVEAQFAVAEGNAPRMVVVAEDGPENRAGDDSIFLDEDYLTPLIR